jgi:hypothetical protein
MDWLEPDELKEEENETETKTKTEQCFWMDVSEKTNHNSV